MVLNLVQPNTNPLHGGSSDLRPGEKEALNCLVVKLGMLSPVSQVSGHSDSNDPAGCTAKAANPTEQPPQTFRVKVLTQQGHKVDSPNSSANQQRRGRCLQ